MSIDRVMLQPKIDKMLDRIPWAEYFMGMAYFASMRSMDPSSKIGCVIIDTEDLTILSTGYNSPPRGMNDLHVPTTRPEKYDWFVHAEEAAICNAAKHGIALNGASMFVTARPCPGCMKKIINVGINNVYYGKTKTNLVDQKQMEIAYKMVKQSGILIESISIEKSIATYLETLKERIEQ